MDTPPNLVLMNSVLRLPAELVATVRKEAAKGALTFDQYLAGLIVSANGLNHERARQQLGWK